jgi:hypothetical protein
MLCPVVLRLREVAEKAIAALPKTVVLPETLSYRFECVQGAIFYPDLQPSWDLMGEFGCGKPQFCLAVLIALLRVLPECYHTKAYLLVRCSCLIFFFSPIH